MPLSLIVGPPNSGRVREVASRLRQNLDQDPLLVIPTADDAARFERELCAGGAALGVSIRTFRWLLEDLARAFAVESPRALSAPQRLALVRAAVRATPLRLLARSARHAGFASALDALIAELQAALVTPGELADWAGRLEDGAYEAELAALYGAYEALRDRARRADESSLAMAVLEAVRRRSADWERRPIFLYGFDDLTQAQIGLLDALAAATDVTVTVTYSDRAALAARAGLLATLRDELGGHVIAELGHDGSHTESRLLAHIDRNLFEPDAGAVPADDGLRLLESAGALGEAEAIGVEIARLLHTGEATPDEIVIVLRHPRFGARLTGRILERFGIPVAIGATEPLGQTAVGRGLCSLCRAESAGGTVEDLLDHLRADPSFPAGAADLLERHLSRGKASTIDDAVSSWRSPPRHLARLREATGHAARLRVLAEIARELAEAPHRRTGAVAGRRSADGPPLEPLELRAGVVAAELLEELATVGELEGCEPPDLAGAAEAIESAQVPLWRGPAEGRVRIVDPYRARVGPARYLFCAGLQEGEFPWAGSGDPLLGEERRAALGIEALRRRDQAEEERYLFHACLSRPTRRVYLSWRASDDEGAPLGRSPFIDDVLDLVEGGEEAEERLKTRRGLAATVLAPSEAPTPRELARALAACGRAASADRALAAMGVEGSRAKQTLELLERAATPPPLPGPLRVPAVLAELAKRHTFSASSLEGWIECPYRWFVDHELRPQRLEPEADPLWVGGVVHRALERLYQEAPGEDSIPRPGDVERWKRRLGELLAETASERGGVAGRTDRTTALARARAQVEAFLEAEAASETELRPGAGLLERSFGFDTEGDPGALVLGEGIALRGMIDRVDLTADRSAALVRDYKLARSVPGAEKFVETGTLQIQLYVLAARERLGLDPIGGLYQPLGGSGDRKLRGMVRRDDDRLAGLDLKWQSGDRVEPEDFEEELRRARDTAREHAERMREGTIDRAPLNGRCPSYCAYQPICRLERAVGVPGANGNGGEE